ncbi:hypothetical protein O6H91_06G146900 [Diphasiastrum complanatum]|uniref:Uncharacterized protein n=1 Tax=Diphasiastrum complanatum TaxID=34168 RepID=A0ACC2DJX2_DIPCM|nr:hypothetical protein O6H91_06G146900 [Diphasiastrum complanatum]
MEVVMEARWMLVLAYLSIVLWSVKDARGVAWSMHPLEGRNLVWDQVDCYKSQNSFSHQVVVPMAKQIGLYFRTEHLKLVMKAKLGCLWIILVGDASFCGALDIWRDECLGSLLSSSPTRASFLTLLWCLGGT